MRVLVIAPHPYYIVRGTPIDLDLVLRVLTARPGTEIDLVVYGEGEERGHPGLTIHRAPVNRLTRGSPPGFSLKKLVSDVFVFFKAWSLVRSRRYDLVHAGEEAVFMAMLFRRLHGVPYAYDLDSSIAEQMVEKMPWLAPLSGLFKRCERAAIRSSLVAFPVCNALADVCREAGAAEVVTLHDISQLEEPGRAATGSLKRELGVEGLLMLYAGNLEAYQGIDLLLEGFALAAADAPVDVAVVGGTSGEISAYRRRARELGVGERVHFLGPRPLGELGGLLAEADILTAPRIRGRNTPMKVFPYMHSGRPVLVTDLPVHTQILTPEVVRLAEPTPAGFSQAIRELASDPALRRRLGDAGRRFVEAGHTWEAHRERLDRAYDRIEARLAAGDR